MKYEEDFDSKFGFGDGGSTPPDAHQVRTVQCYALNYLAQAVGSTIRQIPLDRGGMHNYYLWRRGPATQCDAIIAKKGLWAFCCGPDNGGWKQPDCHWDNDVDVPKGDPWHDVWDACNGAGEDQLFMSEVGYEFVNGRNQIRRAALEAWCRKAANVLRRKLQ